MTGFHPAVVDLSGGDIVLVLVVALISLGALAMAVMFRQEVLAADEGTENMKNIAHAVQEGANAYLKRQFRTLGIFAAIAFFALLALPADDAVLRLFRSVFFLVGAGFSAAIGYLGMWLAGGGGQASLAVGPGGPTAGRAPAMNVAFRTGAFVGMATVGLGLLGASAVVLFFEGDAPVVLEGFGFGAAMAWRIQHTGQVLSLSLLPIALLLLSRALDRRSAGGGGPARRLRVPCPAPPGEAAGQGCRRGCRAVVQYPLGSVSYSASSGVFSWWSGRRARVLSNQRSAS